jgi:hypothetical protein
MELEIGSHVVLMRGGTIVDGLVSGWMVAGGVAVRLFIENIDCEFKLVGDDPWMIMEEAEDEI